MTNLNPGDVFTGDGYCIKCKEKREFSAVITVVQSRLIAKGYCTYCGTKLNRILGAYMRPPERLTDISAAYEQTIKKAQADWDKVKARIVQIYGLTADDVARATGKFEPIPSIEDIARAYDGCDDPACTLCKNPPPNG
jgi:hypothetical protein